MGMNKIRKDPRYFVDATRSRDIDDMEDSFGRKTNRCKFNVNADEVIIQDDYDIVYSYGTQKYQVYMYREYGLINNRKDLLNKEKYLNLKLSRLL